MKSILVGLVLLMSTASLLALDLEWAQQRAGYSAGANVFGLSSNFGGQQNADCSGPVASKTCDCTDGGKRVVCRGTTIYALQNDIPCPQNIQHLTLINPQFISRCLTRDNMTSLPNLRTLTITGSNLEILSRDVFRSQRQLKVLDLRGNLRLSTIDPDAFCNVPALTCVDLSNNERLGNLPPTLFSRAARLQTLNLSSIGLTELPPLGNEIRVLDISRNQLASLSSDFVTPFCRLEQVFLAENPWCCSRQSRWLSMFLRIFTDKGVIRDQPVCQGPNELYGWPIQRVSPDRMDSYNHCKGYSGVDDSRSCNELYSLFRNVVPQLPSSPDNRVLYDDRANNQNNRNNNNNRQQQQQNQRQQQQHQQLAHHQTQVEDDEEDQRGRIAAVGGKNKPLLSNNNRQWNERQTTPQTSVIVPSGMCFAAIGGDCTTGNIIVGTIAAVAGAGLIAATIGIVRFVQRRRVERFRAPSVF